MISKDLTNSVCEIFNSFEAKMRCPVELIGKNSVIPSTIDKISV
jgi:hypothetical protein